MELKIRKAAENDIAPIIELMRDFAEFENLLQNLEITAEKLRTAMFAENSFVESIVACDGKTIFGYAIFYPHFSSFRGQCGFYLEDIYIKQEFRGGKVGEKMLGFIAGLAKSRGFERIDFQVLEWNAPAVNFYKKFGAVIDETERHFKFTDQAFENLAKSSA